MKEAKNKIEVMDLLMLMAPETSHKVYYDYSDTTTEDILKLKEVIVEQGFITNDEYISFCKKLVTSRDSNAPDLTATVQKRQKDLNNAIIEFKLIYRIGDKFYPSAYMTSFVSVVQSIRETDKNEANKRKVISEQVKLLEKQNWLMKWSGTIQFITILFGLAAAAGGVIKIIEHFYPNK